VCGNVIPALYLDSFHRLRLPRSHRKASSLEESLTRNGTMTVIASRLPAKQSQFIRAGSQQ
jgi:hypothetical protein